MNAGTLHHLTPAAVLLAVCLLNPSTYAQRGRGPQGPQVVSPEVSAERRITFRILAPKAQAVRLSGSDIPGNGQGASLAKGTNDVWEVTIGPIEPGAYRYNFNLDGVSVIDPRNPAVSESNNNVWSLVQVPGSDFADTQDVPHGAVSAVTYYSQSLGKFRRLHVYTPPGYESGKGKYPGLLPAARRGGLRRGLDLSGACRLHSGQSHRRRQSQTDGGGNACRPYPRLWVWPACRHVHE